MSKTLVTLFLAGLGGYAVYQIMKPEENLVTGRSGHKWRVVLRGAATGGAKEWEVFAPAGSWGPHAELSVVRYSQLGSDMASRKITGVGQGVPAEMLAGAQSDFGLVQSGGVLPLGTSGS
jgi:hypothetical protein